MSFQSWGKHLNETPYTTHTHRPKFALVVVKKRINTRIFRSEGRLANPPPGTVVDDVVTKPEW